MVKSAMFCKQCGVPLLELSDNGLCGECTYLSQNPDAISKRTHIGKTPFKDCKHIDEDDRIKELVVTLRQNKGRGIALMVDCGPKYQGKGDRYIEKLRTIIPEVKIVSRGNGPVPNTELIVFTL